MPAHQKNAKSEHKSFEDYPKKAYYSSMKSEQLPLMSPEGHDKHIEIPRILKPHEVFLPR